MFLTVCHCFPLVMPKSKTILLLFASLLFFKEQQERFALGIAISLFRSQKRVICSKNQKANSQPWFITISAVFFSLMIAQIDNYMLYSTFINY